MGGADLLILANPQARRLRRSPDLPDRLARRLGGRGRVAVPDGLEALEALAVEVARDPPAVVGLLGGDGTCGRSLGALTRAFGDRPLPPVAFLGGGTMNTLARSVGVRGRPEARLDDVLAHLDGRRPLGTVQRHLLEVDGDRRGFLFGNGLFARYIEAYEAGRPGPARAAWVLARAVGSALRGGPFARQLTRPFEARVLLDGEPVGEGPFRVVAAGTMDQVGLGFQPFVEAVRRPGHLAVIAIACPPAALATQLHHTLRGRPMRHPQVWERVGRRLVIEGTVRQPYMLDGDLGTTGPTTVLEVGPAIALLTPAAPRHLPGPAADPAAELSRQGLANAASAPSSRPAMADPHDEGRPAPPGGRAGG
jgi:diacylglycerol kinase (ATP)